MGVLVSIDSDDMMKLLTLASLPKQFEVMAQQVVRSHSEIVRAFGVGWKDAGRFVDDIAADVNRAISMATQAPVELPTYIPNNLLAEMLNAGMVLVTHSNRHLINALRECHAVEMGTVTKTVRWAGVVTEAIAMPEQYVRLKPSARSAALERLNPKPELLEGPNT